MIGRNSKFLRLRWLLALLLSLLWATMGSAAPVAKRIDFGRCPFAPKGTLLPYDYWKNKKAPTLSHNSCAAKKTVQNSAGDDVTRTLVRCEDDLVDEALRRMDGSEWVERKPGFWRKKDGSAEIELSPGHSNPPEGPHLKVSEFDPTKGKKGGMRVKEKWFVEGKE